MIWLTEYSNGSQILVNPDHIIKVDKDDASDVTRISLTHNKKIFVTEDLDAVDNLCSRA